MPSSIAIVVPVFNPHEKWEVILIERYQELLQRLPNASLTLYLINDGSAIHMSENEIASIKSAIPHFHFIDCKVNMGKGSVLRQAIEQCKEEYIIYTDIDLPFTVESMLEIIAQLPSFDLVFGIKKRKYYEQLSLQRKMVSLILQKAIKILFPSLPVSDTQCGLKGMNAKGKEIFLQTKINRYLFDLEFILYASKSGLKIKPIPVSLRDGIVFGQMNNRVLLQESKNLWKILRRQP